MSSSEAQCDDEAIVDRPRAAASERSWGNTFAVLSNANFRMLMLGWVFYMAAFQIDVVARSWLAYNISGSGLTLGFVMLARGLPQLFFAVLGGMAADRFDLRKVLIYTQVALAVLATANALLVIFDIIEVWHLVVLGALQGVLMPLNFPARNSYIPVIVAKDDWPRAMALAATGQNLNRIVAPGVAGLLISWNASAAFSAIAACYVFGVASCWNLPSRKTLGRTSNVFAEVAASLRLVARNSVLRVLLLLAFAASILGLPFQSLLTVFQTDVLHVEAKELGYMFMAAGIGALLGSLVVARLSDHPRRGLVQLVLGAAFGVSLVAFSQSRDYVLSIALLVVVGFAAQGFVAINNVMVMLSTDPRYYGRVLGIYYLTWSFLPIATMPMGTVVDLVGAPSTLTAAGLLLALVFLTIALRNPAHWRLPAKRGS